MSSVRYDKLERLSSPKVQIMSNESSPRVLLCIHPDGTVEGEICDAGEAARVFVESLRHLLKPGDLIERGKAIEAIEELSPKGLKPKGVGMVANITIAKATAAIRALPGAGEPK